jgi:hypothetical protein
MKRRTRAFFVLFSAFAMTMTMTMAVMAPRAHAKAIRIGPLI